MILVDVSGSAKLSAVLDLVDRYESIFKESLRLIIVKSFRLTCLLDRARPCETSLRTEGRLRTVPYELSCETCDALFAAAIYVRGRYALRATV